MKIIFDIYDRPSLAWGPNVLVGTLVDGLNGKSQTAPFNCYLAMPFRRKFSSIQQLLIWRMLWEIHDSQVKILFMYLKTGMNILMGTILDLANYVQRPWYERGFGSVSASEWKAVRSQLK
jgi:hypothetical protein